MNLTSEQLAVLSTNSDLVINAVAGSGKTTTLIEYARTRPKGSKILYLAFNKTVKTEAVQKFSAARLSNVAVATAHSLAFDHIVKQSRYKLVSGYKSHDLSKLLGIKTGDRHADLVVANHVNKFISFFCNSSVPRVQELNYVNTVTDAKAKSFVNNFYEQIEKFTRETLAKMEKGEIRLTHDFYLKKFQLTEPVLPYDFILFDEGQDASPAMLDVSLKQHSTKIIVGDMHQQIYGWRYAINSLQQVDFPVFNLSTSFRFNDEIAMVANKILGWKDILGLPPAVKIKGAGGVSALIHSKATLGRTNLSLLLNAISQWQHGSLKRIYFEGNINSYTFSDEGASVYDVVNLYNGKRDKIKDALISEMNSMKDLEEYISKTDDNSLRIIVDVVKEFGNRLPSLISELKHHHTDRKDEADMIFSTVHRCKGMEYDEVTLLNDFITEPKLQKYCKEKEGKKLDEGEINRLAEEVNILYVAATRAKHKLLLPPEIHPFKSIGLAAVIPPLGYAGYRRRAAIEPGFYEQIKSEYEFETKHSRATNHGKKWTEEEQQRLTEMFSKGSSTQEIARQLSRGENGVRIKLMSLGLLDGDYSEF